MERARGARVWAAISACAQRDGAVVSLRHVVMACADALAAEGTGLALARDSSPREPVLASAAAVEELEDLQFTLGEGPGIDAVAGHGPVLAGDLTRPDAQRRWPAFAPAAADRGVRGLFAFPVALGAVLVGVLDVYRLQAGPLSTEELANALVFADVTLMMVLDERGGITAGAGSLADDAISARRAQVHQATGMAAAQLGVPVADALAALRARAYAHGQSLADLAADILARRVRLDADGSESPRDALGPDGAASNRTRQNGNNSAKPGGRHGEETR